MLGVGPLETSTGLAESDAATIQQLSRHSIWFVLRLLRLLGRPIVDTVVALDGGRVVGTGTIVWLPKTAYVAGMATRPEYRGRGIASRVLALLGERARQQERAWLALDVEGENVTAQNVYQKAGYRESGRFAWFTRNDLPPVGSTAPAGVREAKRADWKALTAELERGRPADYCSALPAGSRVLGHNEYIVRTGRVKSRTWLHNAVNGTTCVVRAYFLPSTRMGVYFPMSTLPEPPSEEFAGVLEAATQWLRPQAPRRCIAVAAEPHGPIAAALEREGFLRVVSSRVMIRKSAE